MQPTRYIKVLGRRYVIVSEQLRLISSILHI